jgi:hypothetical protein
MGDKETIKRQAERIRFLERLIDELRDYLRQMLAEAKK